MLCICPSASWCVLKMASPCATLCNSLGPHYHFSEGLFWCCERHQRGPRRGGRGVGGGPGPAVLLPSPRRGAGHSVYHWQADPDDEAACTADAVFEQGRGLPRHAGGTRAGRPSRTRRKEKHEKAKQAWMCTNSWWVWHMFRRSCRGKAVVCEDYTNSSTHLCCSDVALCRPGKINTTRTLILYTINAAKDAIF